MRLAYTAPHSPGGALCGFSIQGPSPSCPRAGICWFLPCVGAVTQGLGSSVASSSTGGEQAGACGVSEMLSAQGSWIMNSHSAVLSIAMKTPFLQLKSMPRIVPRGCRVQGLSTSFATPCQLFSCAGLRSSEPSPRRSGPSGGSLGHPCLRARSANPSLSPGMFSYFLKVSPAVDPLPSPGSLPQLLTSPANTAEQRWVFFLCLPYQNKSLGLLIPPAGGFPFSSSGVTSR